MDFDECYAFASMFNYLYERCISTVREIHYIGSGGASCIRYGSRKGLTAAYTNANYT